MPNELDTEDSNAGPGITQTVQWHGGRAPRDGYRDVGVCALPGFGHVYVEVGE